MKHLRIIVLLISLLFIVAGQTSAQTPFTSPYPTSLDTPVTLGEAADNAHSTLASGINNSVTSLTLVNAASFPSSGLIVIDSEYTFYTGKSTNTLTGLLRGRLGTAAASHSAAAVVSMRVSYIHFKVLADAIQAIEAKLGTGATIALAQITSSSSIPTSVSNDTNVTGSIVSNVFNLGWTGTLADGRIASASTWNAKVSSVAGTSNRITIGGTATAPTVDISASFIGQNSITTVGTIGTGVWQGTQIANAFIATISAAGKVSDSALSSNVPLKNAANSFSAQQTVTSLVSPLTTTASTENVFEQTGDTNGTSRLRLQNRSGVAGAILENAALDVADLVFKGATNQRSIRYEARSGSSLSGGVPEFAFGTAGDASLVTSDTATIVRKGSLKIVNGNTLTVTLATLTAGRTLSIPNVDSTVVQPATAPSNQFAISISAAGAITFAQPTFANLSGSLQSSQLPALSGDLTTSGFVATLASTAVTPGSYTNTNLTVNSKGQITAASNGSGGSGGGDASTNTATSVVNEIPQFADTGGKTFKRASGTGIVKLTSGVLSVLTDPLPLANGGTGSATQNFVDLTAPQTIAGIKTFTSVPILLIAPVGESTLGNSAVATMLRGADGSSGAQQTANTPSLYLQRVSSGGARNAAMYGFNFNYQQIGLSQADVYAFNLRTTIASDLTGGTTGGNYWYQSGRDYMTFGPTNIPTGSVVTGYGWWSEAERTAAGVSLYTRQQDIYNNTASDAGDYSTAPDKTGILASYVGGDPAVANSGAHNSFIWYGQGHKRTSAYWGLSWGPDFVVQTPLNFGQLTATLQGTWTSNGTTVITGSGGHADYETVFADRITFNGVVYKVLASSANSINTEAVVPSASTQTITKSVQAAWLANNSYILGRLSDATLTGTTWAATSGNNHITISSGGAANTETQAGDVLTVGTISVTVLSATANDITLTRAFPGASASSLTLTRQRRQRVLGVSSSTTDPIELDPDGAGTNIGGQVKITKTSSSFGAAVSSLLFENPAGTATNVYFTFAAAERGSIRVDTSGNFVLNSFANNFYFNADLGSTPTFTSTNGAINHIDGLKAALGTITSAKLGGDFSATWNSGGTTFGLIKGYATDTASAAGSLLLDLGVGASTNKFKVDKSGNTTLLGTLTAGSGPTTVTNSTGLVLDAAIVSALTGKTYNGLTISTSTGTLTVTNGKTVSISNTLTFSGTDSSSVAFGAGGTIGSVGYASIGQIPGTTTNDSGSAGNVGQVISSNIASGSAITLTTTTTANLTSLSLTAGDWDVWVDAYFVPGGTVSLLDVGVSQTSATLGFTNGDFAQVAYPGLTLGNTTSVKVGPSRVSLASTTTVYGVVQATFGTSMTAYGLMRARRVR